LKICPNASQRERSERRDSLLPPNRKRLTLDELEQAYILEILREAGGNKSRAAEILGLDRKTLYRKLDEYRARRHPALESAEIMVRQSARKLARLRIIDPNIRAS
jgi:DNA-binding NtrC family response regulator